MQISNVLSGFTDTALGRQGEAAEAIDFAKSDAGGHIVAAFAGRADALSDILSQYDVSDISPGEFSQMAQKLFDAGVISDKELQQLAAIRLDLDTAGVEPDESVDLLDFYSEKIGELQQMVDLADDKRSAAKQLAPVLRRLDWIQKFAMIQSDPDSVGLDALV
jgi:hypothetical protein